MNKYSKIIGRDDKGYSDVYDVLAAFGVTNQATGHAIKKLLAPGQRGSKDKLTDLMEAGQSIERAVQIENDQRPQRDENVLLAAKAAT